MSYWHYAAVIAVGLVLWVAAYNYGVWQSRNA